MKRTFIICLLLFCTFNSVCAQKQGMERIDSLNAKLATKIHDTTRIKILADISNTYANINPEEGLTYGNKSLAMAKKCGMKSGMAKSYRALAFNYISKSEINKAFHYDSLAFSIYSQLKDSVGMANIYIDFGTAYADLSNQRKAIEFYMKALGINLRSNNKELIAICYANMANSYSDLSEYAKALEYYFAALKIGEELNDKLRIAIQYTGIASVYLNQSNYDKALNYNFKALKHYESIKFNRGLAAVNNNIGNIYSAQKKFNKSLEFSLKALEINRKMGRKKGIALNLGNIGRTHQNIADSIEDISDKSFAIHELLNAYSNSIQYLTESKELCEEIDFKYGLQLSLGNLGGVHQQIANSPHKKILDHFVKGNRNYGLKIAKDYTLKAIKIQEEIGDVENQKLYYENLAIIANDLGEFKEAFQYLKRYDLLKDSLNSMEEKEKSLRAEMDYEYLKKETEAKAIQEKKDIIVKEEIKKKILQRNYFIIGFCLIATFLLFVVRSYKNKQKSNIEISMQRDIIQSKNKEITDSINYAVAIQNAKLPRRSVILNNLKKSLIVFKPKDIVSGDFYFFFKKENEIFLAAVDCTGHGIPGAFMSMIGSEKLYECIMRSSDLSEILSNMNQGIKASLRQNDVSSQIHDGMDMAICKIIYNDDGTTELTYAGANRPIWIFMQSSPELIEIKGTKKAIGGFTEDDQFFESHVFNLSAGDTFYIFTDGYADSFNEKRKKLTTKGFKSVLSKIQLMEMEEQERYLTSFHQDYIQQTEQIDDILIIGVRV